MHTIKKGRQALPKAQELKPDIVLIDLMMPDLPGLDAIPRLREALPHLGIIALTELDAEDYRQGALAVGADAFILKKDMQTELMPLIHRVLEERRVGHKPTSGRQ